MTKVTDKMRRAGELALDPYYSADFDPGIVSVEVFNAMTAAQDIEYWRDVAKVQQDIAKEYKAERDEALKAAQEGAVQVDREDPPVILRQDDFERLVFLARPNLYLESDNDLIARMEEKFSIPKRLLDLEALSTGGD